MFVSPRQKEVTDRQMDRWMDQSTDRRTHPLEELWLTLKKQPLRYLPNLISFTFGFTNISKMTKKSLFSRKSLKFMLDTGPEGS